MIFYFNNSEQNKSVISVYMDFLIYNIIGPDYNVVTIVIQLGYFCSENNSSYKCRKWSAYIYHIFHFFWAVLISKYHIDIKSKKYWLFFL